MPSSGGGGWIFFAKIIGDPPLSLELKVLTVQKQQQEEEDCLWIVMAFFLPPLIAGSRLVKRSEGSPPVRQKKTKVKNFVFSEGA